MAGLLHQIIVRSRQTSLHSKSDEYCGVSSFQLKLYYVISEREKAGEVENSSFGS